MTCVHRPVVFNLRHTTAPLSPAFVKYASCYKSQVVEPFCTGLPDKHVSMSPLIGFQHRLHQHLALGVMAKRQISRGVHIICCFIWRPAVSTDETSYEAGIKVQIHSQDEPPFIDQLGFGVAPGFQTFVSCQQQLVSNIQPPPLQPRLFFLFFISLCFILCWLAKSMPASVHHLSVGKSDCWSVLCECCDCTVGWQTVFSNPDTTLQQKQYLPSRVKSWLDALQYSLRFGQPKKTPPTQDARISGSTDFIFTHCIFST